MENNLIFEKTETMAPVYLCGSCDVSVAGKRSLLCIVCDSWFHTDCEGISKDVFQMLDKNRNLKFTCKNCIANPVDNSGIDKSFKKEIRDEFAEFRKSLINLAADIKQVQTEMNNKFDSVVSEIRSELVTSIKNFRDEVESCRNLVLSSDKNTKQKINELELTNNILQHRLNRNDVIVSGVPKEIKDLDRVILDLCAYYKMNVDVKDFAQIIYIRRNTSILVRFNNTSVRDLLMKSYFQNKKLVLSDIYKCDGGDNISNRVYLNDNLTPVAAKLLKTCRSLVKEKKIFSFKMMNRSIPKCRVKVLQSDEPKSLNLEQALELFESSA